MLRYDETNWQYEEGFQTHSYQITFEEIMSQSTIEEQKKRPERLSLVKIFEDKERTHLFDICRLFHKNDEYFYFDKNKRFHSTLLGFPVVEPESYDAITEKISQYCEEAHGEMNVKFDLVRLGTKYENNNILKPVSGVSNGTIIAFGDYLRNGRFTTFGNRLTSFLLDNADLNTILGKKFRRRFPTVWCTMGHYATDFKVTSELEMIFNELLNLDSEFFDIPCHELELGKSCYKDLRDWKPIEKFNIF